MMIRMQQRHVLLVMTLAMLCHDTSSLRLLFFFGLRKTPLLQTRTSNTIPATRTALSAHNHNNHPSSSSPPIRNTYDGGPSRLFGCPEPSSRRNFRMVLKADVDEEELGRKPQQEEAARLKAEQEEAARLKAEQEEAARLEVGQEDAARLRAEQEEKAQKEAEEREEFQRRVRRQSRNFFLRMREEFPPPPYDDAELDLATRNPPSRRAEVKKDDDDDLRFDPNFP